MAHFSFILNRLILVAFACLFIANTSHATHHSPEATEAFDRLHLFLQRRTAAETSICQGFSAFFKRLQRTCCWSSHDLEVTPDYDYLTRNYTTSLATAKKLWMEAERNADISDEQIRNSDELIMDLQQALYGNTPSDRMENLIADFQYFLKMDFRVKNELRKHCLSTNATPLLMGSIGVATTASLPTAGVYLGGCLTAGSVLFHLFVSPREVYSPSLTSLSTASQTDAPSILPCPSAPIEVCWPTPSEVRVRSEVAELLENKIRGIAVPRVVEVEFLMLVLAHYYHQTSFGAISTLDPNPESSLLTGAARSEDEMIPSSQSDEELPSRSQDPVASEEIEKCPICWTPGNPELGALSSTRCNHKFHARCLRLWLAQNPTCPICRKQLH